VDADAAREFLRSHHRAVLATRRRDGGVQLSPIVCAVDDAGRVIVSTRETAFKVRNLERDPRAALCVFADGFFGPWVQIDGPVEIVRLPGAMEPLADHYRRAAGEHPDWAEFRAAMERERRVLLRISIERAGPDRAG
jgi:PPOX class probable F420-dependent enzyme